MSLLKSMRLQGVIPVIAIDCIEDAIPIANSFKNKKFNILEITLRTPCAIDAIKLIKQTFPEMMIGIGTVVTKSQIDSILEVKPDFIVTPGTNPKIVEYALSKDLYIIPGVDCASQIETAMDFNLDFVKFFPAEASGGLNKIRALSGPYYNMHFMPTGGIKLNNIMEYLSFNKINAVGGTFFIDKALIKEGNYQHIEEVCNSVISKLLELKIESLQVKDTSKFELCKLLFNLKDNQITKSNENIITISTVNKSRFDLFVGEIEFGEFKVIVEEK